MRSRKEIRIIKACSSDFKCIPCHGHKHKQIILLHHAAQVMLNVVGRLMAQAVWIVRYIAFDAHCAHGWFREALFGYLETLKPCDLLRVPFFSKIKHKKLPQHALPNLPCKLAMYEDLPVIPLPGVCFFGHCFRSATFFHFLVVVHLSNLKSLTF